MDPPAFPSRLRAKREERQKLQESPQTDAEDVVKRRERAEARKRVIESHGSVWDAVSNDDLKMLQSYFLVEGAQTLLRRRHPDAEQGGRSLLHYAAWYGHKEIVEFILSTGYDVDTIDSFVGGGENDGSS